MTTTQAPAAPPQQAMRLVCSQADLNTNLQLAKRAVSTRPKHPVLANVLLLADAATGRMTLTGFDQNIGIQASFIASVETSGAITVPAALFSEIVAHLSGDAISICCEGTDVLIGDGRSSCRISGMDAEDFPDLPLAQSGAVLQLEVGTLLGGLHTTLVAAFTDDTKPLLMGVHLTIEPSGLECAATDGHRMAVQRIDYAISELPDCDGEPFEVTVPAKALRELERLLAGHPANEPLSLFYKAGQLVVIAGGLVLTTCTMEAAYPKYRSLIPTTFATRITVDRRQLIAALELVAVVAAMYQGTVKLIADQDRSTLTVSAEVQDVGSSTTTLIAVIEGKAITIGFNVRYPIEGLKAITTDRVTLCCNAPISPVVFEPVAGGEGYTYLVMPIQIRTG